MQDKHTQLSKNTSRPHSLHEQTNLILSSSQIKAKIVLRFNTIFKQIKPNFFSLLDNGRLVWGFDIISKQADAQTFAIVIQNTLTSLKGLYYARKLPCWPGIIAVLTAQF